MIWTLGSGNSSSTTWKSVRQTPQAHTFTRISARTELPVGKLRPFEIGSKLRKCHSLHGILQDESAAKSTPTRDWHRHVRAIQVSLRAVAHTTDGSTGRSKPMAVVVPTPRFMWLRSNAARRNYLAHRAFINSRARGCTRLMAPPTQLSQSCWADQGRMA